mgnify:FL=1
MKTIKYIISGILLAISLNSCDLDTEPTDQVPDYLVLENAENAEKVLNGTWAYLMDTYFTYQNPGWKSLLLTSDAMANDVAVQPGKYGYISHYSFTDINNPKSTTGRGVWTLAYKGIDNANHLITKIDGIPGDESLKSRVKAQAYALRGYLYLNLVTFYSHAYKYDTQALSVPIYLEPTVLNTVGGKRETVEAVYGRAEEDLLEAYNLIGDFKRNTAKHKFDKKVIAGILSRLYLQKEDWKNANKYAAEAGSSATWMTKNEYLNGFNDQSNSEWIWGHGQIPNQSTASYSFHFQDVSSQSSYYYSFMADPYFEDFFDKGDVRSELFESDTTRYKGGLMYKKFKFRPDVTADIVLMRKAELVLIEAEALAELGSLPQAITKLNELRTQRGAQTPDLSSLSKDELVEEILIERRKELFGEGFGLYDLKRRQKAVSRKRVADEDFVEGTKITKKGHTVFKFPDGTDFTANSDYYLFAIPDSEITNNGNL